MKKNKTTLVIKVTGTKAACYQALTELLSNIQYEKLNCIVRHYDNSRPNDFVDKKQGEQK